MGELLFSDKLQLHNWQQSQTILCSKEDYGEFIVTFLFSSLADHISSYAHNTITIRAIIANTTNKLLPFFIFISFFEWMNMS